MDIITFDEFKKMDLRVAHILKAEKVEGTQKLLKLQIDIGTEQRQIVAGIAETYKPEDFVGKKTHRHRQPQTGRHPGRRIPGHASGRRGRR